MNQLLLVTFLTKILKALVLQEAAKVRKISEFQSRRVMLLFGVFLLGSFSGLSPRGYAQNMDSFILFS